VADVAVVAHSRKSFGGGLPALREFLAREGVTDPLWYEVNKSRRAPEYARRAAAQGADVIFVWGGDGTVQRCIDAVAGTDTAVAILPAGTANLLALGHPDESPFVKVTQGKKFRIRFDQKVRYELDDGARPASKKLRIKVRPGSVTVCVPPRRRE
jgi:diacylglycerol kinase family enzyme